MREYVGFTLAWSTAVCACSMGMDLVGFGHPNCEPSVAGYVGFYATLFFGSVASFFLAWLLLGVLILARNCMRAMR